MSEQRDRINELIERFGRERDLVLDPVNAEGFTQISRGSATVRINVLEDHGVLLLIAPIMRVPERNTEAFYRRLLELSFLTTADASFAIDAAKDEIFVRTLRRLSGLDYEEFEDLLETVGRVADEWDDVLKREFPA